MRDVAAVVLAAGSSSRLGRPKQLIDVGGRSLLRRTVDCALDAGCSPVIVVLGAEVSRMRAAIEGLPVMVTLNARWGEGLASSVRAGAAAACDLPAVRAALFLCCDQPLLTADILTALGRAFDGSPGAMAACEYEDTIGTPALFERSRFPELLALAGPAGAKQVLLAHPRDVHRVAWPEGAVDVDRPADLQRIAAGLHRGSD